MFSRFTFSRNHLYLFRSLSKSFCTYAPITPDFNKALVYKKFGNPCDVIELENYIHSPLPDIKDGQVRIKMLNAAVNLTDLATIQGKTTNNISFPAVPGDEGLGVIEDPGNSSFERGDYVIPAKPGLGTWRSFLVCNSDDVIKVRQDIAPETAACLFVSPVTAHHLVNNFVDLQPGDVIIQNGGSGLVAQTVIQLCAAKGVKVINVVRQRGLEEYGEIVERSKKDGAYIVISDNHIDKPRFKKLIYDLPSPKLALNCSGGESATNIARLLGKDGTLVNYGNASNTPVILPTSLFIERNITIKSYNFGNWLECTSHEEKQKLVNNLADSVCQRSLKLWIECSDMWDYKTVFTKMMYPKERKFVFSLHNNGIK